MPSPEEIVAGLSSIANSLLWLAVAWHVVIGMVLAGLAGGCRPSRRSAATGLALPLVSVGVVAFAFGNAFNGVVFLLLALVMIVLARGLSEDPVAAGPTWVWVLGLLVLGFGWLYPHFLEDGGPLVYLYAAPMGLIPCPTLSMVTGFALMAGGFGGRGWSLVLATAGVFYGLFGAFRLGVVLDVGLLIGAFALLTVAILMPGAGGGEDAGEEGSR